MIKKIFFLPLCLAISFSVPTQAQLPSIQHNAIKHLSAHDVQLLEETIKQLPDKEKATLEQILLEKAKGGSLLGLTGATIIAIGLCSLCCFFPIFDGGTEQTPVRNLWDLFLKKDKELS